MAPAKAPSRYGTTVRQLNVTGSDGTSIAQLADEVTVQEGDNVTLSADAEAGTLSPPWHRRALASVTSDRTRWGWHLSGSAGCGR